MVRSILILLLAISLVSFVYADTPYYNCEVYGTCSKIVNAMPVNYSLVNVNNSQFLEGHPASYFYQASNPLGFITGFTELDPVFSAWLSGFAYNYNQTTPAINTILGFSYYNSSSNIGNWTLDKPSYSTGAQVISNISEVNTNIINNASTLATNIVNNITALSNSTIARIGTFNCSTGQVLMNVTSNTSGIYGQCVTPSSGGNSSDQWTNTTSNVSFNNINTTGQVGILTGVDTAGAGLFVNSIDYTKPQMRFKTLSTAMDLQLIGGAANTGDFFMSATFGSDQATNQQYLWFYNGQTYDVLNAFTTGYVGDQGRYFYYPSPKGIGFGYTPQVSGEVPASYFTVRNQYPVTEYSDVYGSLNPGTVSVSGTAVTGVNTQFTKSFNPGSYSETISFGGGSSNKAIASVTDDTHLTLSSSATTVNGVTYKGSKQVIASGFLNTGYNATGYSIRFFKDSGSTKIVDTPAISKVVDDEIVRLVSAPSGTAFNNLRNVKFSFISSLYPEGVIEETFPNSAGVATGGINFNYANGLYPTAQWDVGGSSDGSPSTAPLKIHSGTLLATPEPGAIESDGTHIYWTDDGGTRHQLDN